MSKKYCPSCEKIVNKVQTSQTVCFEKSVHRRNVCGECEYQFFTEENESDRASHAMARKFGT